MTPEESKVVEEGLFLASFIQLSRHEWKWSQKEQEAMARALCALSKDHSRLEQQLDIRSRHTDDSDLLMTTAIEKIAEAADLLGWDIHIHEKNDEVCDGIIIGHPKYAEKALEAFDKAEQNPADPS